MSNRRPLFNARGEFDGMRNKTIGLHLADSCFDIAYLDEVLCQPARDAHAKFLKELPPAIASNQSIGTANTLSVAMPIVSELATAKRHTKPHMNRNIMTFDSWQKKLSPLSVSHPPDTKHGHVRAFQMRINMPEEFPTDWFYQVDAHDVVSGPRNTLVLSPEILGRKWDAWLATFTHLYHVLNALEYLRAFGMAVAQNCTTAGITKRVWPEAVHFVPAYIAEEVKAAKMSAWPGGLKSQLEDYNKHPVKRDCDAAYLHKTMTQAADAILASKLMEPFNSHWNTDDVFGSVERVELCDLHENGLPPSVKALVSTVET